MFQAAKQLVVLDSRQARPRCPAMSAVDRDLHTQVACGHPAPVSVAKGLIADLDVPALLDEALVPEDVPRVMNAVPEEILFSSAQYNATASLSLRLK